MNKFPISFSAEPSKDKGVKSLFVVAFFPLALGIEPKYWCMLGKALSTTELHLQLSNPFFDEELGTGP